MLLATRMTSAATESAEMANSVAEANKKRYEEQANVRKFVRKRCEFFYFDDS